MNTPLKILSLTLLFHTLFFTCNYAATLTGKVVRVLDGDTIEVLVDKKPIRIRLADIDCPEKKQPFGNAAKKYVLEVAAHEIVTVDARSKDRYGRTIGEVFLPSGESLNRLLIRDGYAWHYKKYSKDKTLAELENQARGSRVGLWQDKAPIAPWDWRHKKRS
jgi:micrococcal nuclease